MAKTMKHGARGKGGRSYRHRGASLGFGESQAGLPNPDLTGPGNDAIEPVSADKAKGSGLEGLEDRPLQITVTARH